MASREARAPSEVGGGRGCHVSVTPPNKPMHPTADTRDFIFDSVAGRRVIGGVMAPLQLSAILWAAFAPLSVALLESYALDTSSASLPAAALCIRAAGAGGGNPALHHNNGMQRSADTKAVMLPQPGRAPADAGR